jgi:TP901 family phage tail tape measure protein
MAAPGLTIPTKFTAGGDYVNQVNRMSSATDRMLGSLKRLNGLGPSLSNTTSNLLGYVKSAALISGAFATASFSAKSIMDYETAIQSLQAVTGATDSQMVGFQKQITELGVTSKKSMTDIAGSFEIVGSAMSQYLGDPKALRMITEAGITLSKASRMELEPALLSLTSVMNQFQLGATQANKTIQTLTAGEIVGAIRTSEASQMLMEFGAVSKNMNVNVGESVALIEALGMQMDKTKIGVGARNILAAIGAAGGLDKKARKDLRKAGVDTKFLMDSTQSLSARLHELSKISKDPIKMVSVFGKENLTAASVIFNQLSTYDRFYDKIQKTSEAENQAATNSRTLSIALEQLKNRWSNMLNSNEDVGASLNKVREMALYVADNLGEILSVAGNVAAGFLIWKGAILAVTAAIKIQQASVFISYYADMLKWYAVTNKVTMATALQTLATESLTGALLLNPITLMVAGLAALAGALYFTSVRTQQLREEYQKKIDLDLVAENEKELSSVKKLALEYYRMGQSIKDATENAIKFKLVGISQKRFKAESEISGLKKQLDEEKNKVYLADLFYGGGTPEVGKRAEIAAQLQKKQLEAARLAQDAASEVGFAKSEQQAGVIGGINLNRYLQPTTKPASQQSTESDFKAQYEMSQQRKNNMVEKPFTQQDFENKRMEIILKNESGSEAEMKTGSKRVTVAPGVKSTFNVK